MQLTLAASAANLGSKPVSPSAPRALQLAEVCRRYLIYDTVGDQLLDMADALVAGSLKLLQRQPLGEVCLIEGPGAALRRVPLRDETRHDAADLVAVHPIGTLVGAGIVGEADLAARHRRGDDLGKLADLVVVRRDADVECLVADRIDRGFKGRQKCARDVLDVSDRTPGRAVGLHVDAPRGHRPGNQVVQH